MDNKILWTPGEEWINNSRMYAFMQRINKSYSLNLADYAGLYRWSVNHIELFWKEVWEYCGIRHSERYQSVVDDPSIMPGARWFEGVRLNYAENLLQRDDDHPAILFRGEERIQRILTFKALREEVRKAAAGLRRLGVKKGDRVAGYLPNIPETVISMLATASIGAIWSSASPDLGTKGFLDRFTQIEPKVIISADGYFYKGKSFNTQVRLKGIICELPSVEKVVIIGYTGNRDLGVCSNSMTWEEMTAETDDRLVFEQLSFDHPLFILYSSGTTGLPKSIVHSAGGTLIQHLKELALHCNIKPDDTIFYYTTCGWMMWNWLVSSLALGATIVLFDGNPFYPEPDTLLKMADALKISFFGTSAKYIASLEDEAVVPSKISAFPELKVIASTGSPLSGDGFEYVYEQWKQEVQLSSISGGTDIISCFFLGNPILPVRKGELQCIGLGMDVDCFDEKGRSLVGEQGELVCKSAFPSMPVYFWNDPDGSKYRNAYFDIYPGIWRHGDFIEIREHGGVVMYGRSDATLNPQGVRIGTAEIYRVVENISEVEDSVVVGKKTGDDEQVVLFVKMKPGHSLTPEMYDRIRKHIRSGCSPRHVPSIIMEAPDIPYTVNGKKVEIAVKKALEGETIKNRDTLSNPESIDFFSTVLKES